MANELDWLNAMSEVCYIETENEGYNQDRPCCENRYMEVGVNEIILFNSGNDHDTTFNQEHLISSIPSCSWIRIRTPLIEITEVAPLLIDQADIPKHFSDRSHSTD